MKAIIKIFFLSFAALLLIGCENGSSDWVKCKNDSDGNIYSYDKGKIKTDSANKKVQVWGKEIYSDKGREKELQSRTQDGLSIEGYDKLSAKTCLYEIDCDKNSIRVLSINHYDKDDKLLYSGGDADEKKWFLIKPDSTGEDLFKEVCQK